MIDTQAGDIIKLDLDGNQIQGDLTQPLETPMHSAIYRARADVNSIVHSHPTMVTAFSMVGHSIDPVYARGVECTGSKIPIFDCPDPIGDQDLAETLAATLGSSRACILRSHGLITVGSTLESACLATINLEKSAMMQWIASAIGKPISMPEQSIKRRQAVWDNPTLLSLVWHYYEEVTANPT
jgi:ribulose-5-phosphate 4-epimerase/fuculose-1-phosphate aldolase